jgi:3-oxoacyl-[acyl-carrier protein] reductase
MMTSDLEGKAALVTGGSRGIGAAIAVRFAEQGADVAITYRQGAEAADGIAGRIRAMGRRALALPADSADARAVTCAVDRTAEDLGRLDILVNNAGIYPSGPLARVTLEEVDRTIAVHVRAAFLASQAAAARMGDGGRIISIGSCFAERVPYAGISLYAMTKAALTGLTKGLARDLGPRGITAIVVHPGNTNTDMNPADAPEADVEAGLIALGRYAEPEEIAAAVVHLAGEAGRYVTGTAITVDGGYAA